MEETWEFAVVSEEVKSDKFLEISDFSPKAHSVQTKFYTVSLISIFVSLFDLDNTSAFFGFKSTDANERIIELGFFCVTVCLAMLFFMRIWEERDVFRQLGERTKKLLADYKSNLIWLKEAHDEFSDTISGSGLLDNRFEKKLESSILAHYKQFGGAASLEDVEKEVYQNFFAGGEVTISDLIVLKRDITEKSQNFAHQLDYWAQQLSVLTDTSTNPRESKKFAAKQKFRLVTFDVLLPVLVTFAVIFAFFFPDCSLFLLEHLVGSEK